MDDAYHMTNSQAVVRMLKRDDLSDLDPTYLLT